KERGLLVERHRGFDLALERSPAGEAVLARQGALHLGELRLGSGAHASQGVGVARAASAHQLLGFFAKAFERRQTGRGFGCGHATTSCVARVRGKGQRFVVVVKRARSGGKSPYPRTGRALWRVPES